MGCSGFSGFEFPLVECLEFPRESSYQFSVTYSQGGVAYDLTSVVATGSILFTVKTDPSLPDSAALFKLGLGTGISCTAPVTGTVIVTISPANSANMLGLNSSAFYDLTILNPTINPTFRQQIMTGRITATTTVTS